MLIFKPAKSDSLCAAVAVEAKPLLAAEAKRNQIAAGFVTGKANAKKSNASVKNDKSIPRPINTRTEVAKQFDVSQGYVYAA